MSKYNDTGMSDLEREFELEMEGDGPEIRQVEASESDSDAESQSDWEETTQSNEGADEEVDEEWEKESVEVAGYADRFFELTQREFESESELDDEVRGLVNEMERDYFWGKWKNRLKRIGGGLLRKGVGQLAGRIPGFKGLQAITQLARGDLKGALGSLAKSGLASLVPGGAVALPALKALGFEATEDSDRHREAWDNYVDVAREAFDYLGRHMSERAADPLEASRLASAAYQTAVRKVQTMGRSGQEGEVRNSRKRTMTIRLRRGERIIIEGI